MATRIIRNSTNSDIYLAILGNQQIKPEGDAGGDDFLTLIDKASAIQNSTQIFDLIALGDLIVLDSDNADVTEPLKGWNWLIEHEEALPFSPLGNTLAVHQSSKPVVSGKEIFAVWTGAGDVVGSGQVGTDASLIFELAVGTPSVVKDIKFDPAHGFVWLHEGYAKWVGGGVGDYLVAYIVAEATPLQQSVNLDLDVDVDGWITYAGAGLGTDGFADAEKIQLIPRTFSKDGDWDYDSVNGLVPNATSTGGYKINNTELKVHNYINKIPTYGTTNSFVRLTSNETSWLPPNFFIRAEYHNVSDTEWVGTIFMEIYRERTHVP